MGASWKGRFHWLHIPKSKQFGTFCLVLSHAGGVKKPRRGYGPAYVFCLASARNNFAKIVPNHFGLGITMVVFRAVEFFVSPTLFSFRFTNFMRLQSAVLPLLLVLCCSQTTEIYTHIRSAGRERVGSPFDDLAGKVASAA